MDPNIRSSVSVNKAESDKDSLNFTQGFEVCTTLNNATNLRNKSWRDESRKKFGKPCGVMVWVGSYLGIWKD